MPQFLNKLVPYAIGLIAVVAVCAGLFIGGDLHGKDVCELKQAQSATTEITRGIKNNAENKNQVMRLSDVDLDGELIRDWLRS